MKKLHIIAALSASALVLSSCDSETPISGSGAKGIASEAASLTSESNLLSALQHGSRAIEGVETPTNLTAAQENRGFSEPIFEGRAARYRSRIAEAWDGRVNFARRFTIIGIGCGTRCVLYFVGDYQSGRIYELGMGGEDHLALRLKFNPESDIILARWEEEYSCVSQSFRWVDNRLSAASRKVSAPTDGYGSCQVDPSD